MACRADLLWGRVMNGAFCLTWFDWSIGCSGVVIDGNDSLRERHRRREGGRLITLRHLRRSLTGESAGERSAVPPQTGLEEVEEGDILENGSQGDGMGEGGKVGFIGEDL